MIGFDFPDGGASPLFTERLFPFKSGGVGGGIIDCEAELVFGVPSLFARKRYNLRLFLFSDGGAKAEAGRARPCVQPRH